MWSRLTAKKAMSATSTPTTPPAKWSVRQLLDYCEAHDIDVARGLSRDELAAIVDEHQTDALLQAQAAAAMKPKEERLAQLGEHTGAELLGYVPDDAYSAPLFADTALLKALVDAGIAQLNDAQWFSQTFEANQVPPLVSWMVMCLRVTIDGKSAGTLLTPATASAAVCGRYFTSKEMVARCEECAADATCVLCMACFQHSPCRNHRVRITPGSGGGMCDCGDPSAWKKESFCSRHRGQRSDDDPLAALGRAERTWAELVLRGAVQAISLTLHQTSTVLQGRKKALSQSALMALLGSWLHALVSTVHEISMASEAARRLLAERWVEALGKAEGVDAAATGFHTPPCLDTLFRFELNVAHSTAADRNDGKWWLTLTQGVGMCLSDAFFRNHFIGMMGKYAERLSKNDTLEHYSVQVFTNADAVRYSLAPSHLPYPNPRDTIVHRSISGCLYYLTTVTGDATRFKAALVASKAAQREGVALADFVANCEGSEINLACFSKLRQSIGLSLEAGVLVVLNQRAFCGVLVFLHIVDVSAGVGKDPDVAPQRYTRFPVFAARYLTVILRVLQLNVRRLLRGYDEVQAHCGSPEAPPPSSAAAAADVPGEGDSIDRQCLERLGVSEAIVSDIFMSGVYDTPPDETAAASAAHACVLRITSAAATSSLHTTGLSAPVRARVTPREWQDRAFRYLVTRLDVVRDFLVSFLSVQQSRCFRGKPAEIVLEARAHTPHAVAPAEAHIYSYDLLEPTAHKVGTTNLLSRLFMMFVQAWVIHATHGAPSAVTSVDDAHTLRRRLADTSIGGNSTSTADAPHRTRPVSRMAELFVAHVTLPGTPACVPASLRNAWFDAAVMPFVLLAQVEGALWRRDDYNVNHTMGLYRGSMTKSHMEYDLAVLQMLATTMPPHNFTLQALERFSYSRTSDAATPPEPPSAAGGTQTQQASAKPASGGARRYSRGYRPGYARFLRLMLTIVLDCSKAQGDSDTTQDTVTRIVAQALAHSRCTHSTLVSAVERTMQSGLGDDEEFDEINTKTAVRTALKEIAVEEDGPAGRVFRLKNTSVWARYVSLYSPLSVDVDREEMFNQYRTTVRLERLGEAKAAGVDGAADVSAPVCVPPPALPTRQRAEFVPHLRALLHTDALLLPALAVLLIYARQLARQKKPGPPSSSPTDGQAVTNTCRSRVSAVTVGGDESVHSSDDDGSEGAWSDLSEVEEGPEGNAANGRGASSGQEGRSGGSLTQSVVQHAVTALYLCAQDSSELSRALRHAHMRLFANEEEAEPTVPPTDDPIDWESVREYLREANFGADSAETPSATLTHAAMTSVSHYTDASVKRVLPLAALRNSGTLRDLLSKRLPETASSSSNGAHSFKTVADILHAVWLHARENPQEDKFSTAHMLRYVLTATGLAEEEVLKDDEGNEKQSAAAADALTRKQQLKARQAKILQRMRIRAGVDGGTAASAQVTGTAVDESGDGAASLATGGGTTVGPQDKLFLHSRLLMHLSTLECCVCRTSTEEPLLFLGNCTTSGVLSHLKAMPLPDGREVHSHFTICGHVAHAPCVRKYFTRLAALWRRGFFQGQRFLGPSEFACPICLMVSQAQVPIPTITSPALREGEEGAAASTHESSTRLPLVHHPAGSRASSVSVEATSGAETVFEEIRRSSLATDTQQEAAASACTALAHASIGFCEGSDNLALVRAEDDLQKTNSPAWGLSETIRTIGYQLHVLVEGAKLGRAVHENDLLALLSLMVTLAPAQLSAHSDAVRANFNRCREPLSLLILDALCVPSKASTLIAEAVAALLSSPEAAKAVEVVLDSVTVEDSERVAQALAQPEKQRMCMVIWTEMACLTLFKVLLVDEAADTVVAGREEAGAYDVCMTPMTPSALASVETRRDGLLRMWQFLAPIAPRHITDALPDVACALRRWWTENCADAERAVNEEETAQEGGRQAAVLPPLVGTNTCLAAPESDTPVEAGVVVYESTAQWSDHILQTVFHLPQQYVSILTDFAQRKVCGVCGANEQLSVQCRYCEMRLCLKPDAGRRPEIYEHTVRCARGVGVFLRVEGTTLLITDAVSGRCVEPRSLYVDEFDETDEHMERGAPLTRSPSEATRFLHTWVMNRWSVESTILKHTWRGNLEKL